MYAQAHIEREVDRKPKKKKHHNLIDTIIEGSLETKVPTIWTDEKQHSQEEAEPGRNSDV